MATSTKAETTAEPFTVNPTDPTGSDAFGPTKIDWDSRVSIAQQRGAIARAQVQRDKAKREASGDSGGFGIFFLLALAAGGAYWWIERNDKDELYPSPYLGSQQPQRRGRGRNTPPRHSEVPDEDKPDRRAYAYSGPSGYGYMASGVDGSIPSRSPAVTPTQPALTASGPTVKNPATLMARRKRSTLVTAKPRTGKSISIANSWPEVQTQGYSVAVVQPKYCAHETYYWQGADRLFGFMLENWQKPKGMDIATDCSAVVDGDRTAQLDKEELAKRLTRFLMEWRQDPSPKKLLIVDELRALKEVLPKWYNNFFAPFMVVEVSSGETSGRIVWIISQSTNCKDIGFSGGDRSMFDLFALETPESAEHYHAIRRCFNGLPEAEEELYARSQSPKEAIFYHSALNGWAPMARLRESPAGGHWPSGIVREPEHLAFGSTEASSGSSSSGGTRDGTSGTPWYARAELEVIARVVGTGPTSEPLDSVVLMAALDAVKAGESKTRVIKEVLGLCGRRYEEGAAIYEQLKAAIDES